MPNTNKFVSKKCNLFVAFDKVGSMDCVRVFVNIFNKYVCWMFSYKDSKNIRWDVISIRERSNIKDFSNLSDQELEDTVNKTLKEFSRGNTLYQFDLNNRICASVKTKVNIDLGNYAEPIENAVKKCLKIDDYLKNDELDWKMNKNEMKEVKKIVSYIKAGSNTPANPAQGSTQSNRHTITKSDDEEVLTLIDDGQTGGLQPQWGAVSWGKIVSKDELNGQKFSVNYMDPSETIVAPNYNIISGSVSFNEIPTAINSGTAWVAYPAGSSIAIENDESDLRNTKEFKEWLKKTTIVNDHASVYDGLNNSAYETLKDDILSRKVKKMAVVLDDDGLVDFTKGCFYEVQDDGREMYLNENSFIGLKSTNGKIKMVNINRLKIMDVFDEPPKKI